MPIGEARWFEIRATGIAAVTQLLVTVYFDPLMVLVSDEDPMEDGVQIGPGDLDAPGAGRIRTTVDNRSGFAALSAQLMAGSSYQGDAVLARLRFRARRAGTSGLHPVAYAWGPGGVELPIGGAAASVVGVAAPNGDLPPCCGPQAGEEDYGVLWVRGASHGHPADDDPDLNLGVRGYEVADAAPMLVSYGGGTDARAPQLRGILSGPRQPAPGFEFNSVWRVFDWVTEANVPGSPIATWPATVAGLAADRGSPVRVPDSGYDIGDGYEAMVLYAAADRITLKYTREDSVVYGYSLHIEGLCVHPALLALYRECDLGRRVRLPALRSGQRIGCVAGSEVRFAIRDSGAFMDPRSQKDWWRAYPVPTLGD